MGSELLGLAVAFAVYATATWVALRLPCGSDGRWVRDLRLPRSPLRWLRTQRQLRRPPRPTARPLELIVSDARRLAPRALHPPRGTSRAKIIALCYAYDHVLAEACTALEIEHLLGVLPPGEELDAERVRVEGLLWLSGLRIDDAV